MFEYERVDIKVKNNNERNMQKKEINENNIK